MSDDNVSQLLANSRLAFLNQENEKALSLAKKAIDQDPNNPEAYKCAGNACMSLERYDKAVMNYRMAVQHDANNGNRYYDLGFALATTEKLADAMHNLAKAEELGCIPENLVQLYNVLGIICFDIGRYDDALINLSKAEQLIGVDMDILQRKAIIHGIKGDVRSGLEIANQIKLIGPSEYTGYKLAFKLLVQAKRLDAAEKELGKAQRYAAPTIDFYTDGMTLELEKYQVDADMNHFNAALAIIEDGLRNVKPTVSEAIESYINAAEIYLQLKNPDRTIDCLNAAQNPTDAYNNGFEIVSGEVEHADLTEYAIEEMIEADREKIAEQFGEYGLEEMVENIDPDEDGNRQYLTEIEDGETDPETTRKFDASETVTYSTENVDQINRLHVGAYTLKEDFEKVIEYARKLQTSMNTYSAYLGKYTEVNAMKEMNAPGVDKKYEETIRYFRNVMIKDPTDIMAVTLRIQCNIDIGNFEEAEELCNLLTMEVKEPLLEKIAEVRKAGG